MQLGSQEHKTQFFQDLIKIYHENIWKDEMHLSMLADVQGNKRKEIAGIELKMENKEFKSANEGKKALFVAEQELKHIEKETKCRKAAHDQEQGARRGIKPAIQSKHSTLRLRLFGVS
jgi:hypothetical protein